MRFTPVLLLALAALANAQCSNDQFCGQNSMCLTPTNISCIANATICGQGQNGNNPPCSALTGTCIIPSQTACTDPCGHGEFCCPDALACLTPTNPGTICSSDDECSNGDICCPLINECVSVGDSCTPSLPFAYPSAKLQDTQYESLFAKWMKDNEKSYEVEELFARFAVFKDNMDIVIYHNSLDDGYTLEMNRFADLTSEEFGNTYNGYKSTFLERIRGTQEKNVVVLDETDLQDDMDWVAQGAVTPVKDQGQCGSCWAFSTTGSTEGAYFLSSGNLVSMSEQQLVDCSKSYGNLGCNGGLMDSAFEYYIEDQAPCTEDSYPYTGETGWFCSGGDSCDASGATVTSYNDVTPDSETQMMAAVGTGPVSVAIEADQSCFQLYSSGVLGSSCACGDSLDHGVLVVGYGTDSGTDYWKVKNSWGTSWGEDGYIRLERGVATDGMCGILSQPSYPVVS